MKSRAISILAVSTLATVGVLGGATPAHAAQPVYAQTYYQTTSGDPVAAVDGDITFRLDGKSFLINTLQVQDRAVDGYGVQAYFMVKLANGDLVDTRTFPNNSGGGTSVPYPDELINKAVKIRWTYPVVCSTSAQQIITASCRSGETRYNPND